MLDIPIVYEDNHLLVVLKPPNLLSQGDHTGDPNLLDILKEDLKIRYQKPHNAFLGLLHRLDRPVGGVMVFAKTSKAASRISQQIRERKFVKKYWAVIHGHPTKEKDTLIHYLRKHRRSNMVHLVDQDTRGAQKASLDYQILEQQQGFSLVKINLHTGRPHQIRVQFSAIGHSLYGDRRYGPRSSAISGSIALWSAEIICQHPTLGKEMVFQADCPKQYPWKIFNSRSFSVG